MLVHGRVQEAKHIPPATATDSVWRNLLNTFKRVDADPLPHAPVRVTIGGTEHDVQADDEGFIRAWLELDEPLPASEPWHPVDFRLLGACGIDRCRDAGRRARCASRRAPRRSA